MGVQSFFDDELTILNRSHTSSKAQDSIKIIQDIGFENMNIDLIFGIPNSNKEKWQNNLNIFFDLDIPHLSCYNLTIEPHTTIAHQIKTGKLQEPNEELNAELFLMTQDILKEKGYEHYEISNYAKNNSYALHNTNYWKGIPYLGFGPSAHSFNGHSRQWNVANNRKYIEQLYKNNILFEKEVLTSEDKYNEYIMTGLRTKWGVNNRAINVFGNEYFSHFTKVIRKYIEMKFVTETDGNYILTREGKLYADKIASDLFI
jgi:oxygen-independent coproporphyrinogen-3 oxidase